VFLLSPSCILILILTVCVIFRLPIQDNSEEKMKLRYIMIYTLHVFLLNLIRTDNL